MSLDAMAASNLAAAFGVTIKRSFRRAGLVNASRTACSPNSHTVSDADARRARSLSITQAGFFTGYLHLFRRGPCVRAAAASSEFRLTGLGAMARQRGTEGDVLQGAAADCNSAGETHAWFDSRVAHHSQHPPVKTPLTI